MHLQTVRAGDARELKDIADAIAKSHKILVMTGAGISTSCGIPDFRSKDGLYNMIPEQALPTPPPSEPSTPHKRKASSIEQAETPQNKRRALDTDDEELPSSQSSTSSRAHRRASNSPAGRMRGQDLFHARVFQRADTTQMFNQFLAGFKQKLRDDVKETSRAHKFIRVLRDGGRLMRCYTQNIDGLEEREGLCVDLARGKGNKRRFMKKYYASPRPENTRDTDFDGGCEVVQLHGELKYLRCTVCSVEEEWTEEASEILLEGAAPKCNRCNDKSEQRQATGKRGLAVGTLRPNIVLYGEEHPQNTLLSPLVPYDIASGPEIMIIMGTSLKVFGMQKIIRDFAKAIHSKDNGRVIFINRTRPAESVWESVIDDFIEMDCDDWVNDLKERRPGLWLRQGELDLKEIKPTALEKKRKSDAVDMNTNAPAKKSKMQKSQLVSVDIPKRKMSPKKKSAPASKADITDPEQTPRATRWRDGKPKAEFRNLLSPLMRGGRPQASPLSRSLKSRLKSQFQSDTPSRGSIVSPQAPPFSPLTPTTPSRFQSNTPSKLRIQQSASGNSNGSQKTSSLASQATGSVLDSDLENRPPSPTHGADPDLQEADEEDVDEGHNQSLSRKLVAAQTDGATDEDGTPLYKLGRTNLLTRLFGPEGPFRKRR